MRQQVIISNSLIVQVKQIKLNTNDDRSVCLTIFLNVLNEQNKSNSHVQINQTK